MSAPDRASPGAPPVIRLDDSARALTQYHPARLSARSPPATNNAETPHRRRLPLHPCATSAPSMAPPASSTPQPAPIHRVPVIRRRHHLRLPDHGAAPLAADQLSHHKPACSSSARACRRPKTACAGKLLPHEFRVERDGGNVGFGPRRYPLVEVKGARAKPATRRLREAVP